MRLNLCILIPVWLGLSGLLPILANPLTQEDWKQIESFREWSNKPLFRRVFKPADVNRDKRITIEEIANYAEKELPRNATSRNEITLKIMFKQNPRSDINRDGVLTKRELITYLNWFVESA
jgi:hypothetical protein